jgi:pimeloyl-ACP methyl ester carboxylesterase
MKKITINGNSLAYERRGKGTPLLLVHGFPLDHRSWQPLLGHLETGFDIILPDLRGFGQSDTPPGVYQVEAMAADLLALLDALHIQKTCIAGHSMGGYVSLAFARIAVDRVLGLGMIGSQAIADTPERRDGRYSTAQQVALDGVSVVVGMAEKLSANPDHIPFFRELILSQPPQGVMAALKAMAERPDSTALLPSLHFPVVLVHGLMDALISPERSRDMKALLPQAELMELPGVGHSPPIEAPYETALALQKLRGE